MSENIRRTLACTGLFAVCSVVAVGCNRDDRALGTERDRTPPFTERRDDLGYPRADMPAPGVASALASAVDAIAAATCDHAQRCNEIGPGDGKDYASREACMAKERKDLGDDLNANSCRGGVVQKELDECLAEARNQDCNAPFDALGKITACRTSDICNAVP